MARWSSQHRKKAFLVACVRDPRFAIGNGVGSTPISDVDQFSGESHDAEAALDRAGLRPTSEVVFLQSDKLTIKDPEFRAAVADVTRRLSRVAYVENVQSPLGNGGSVSEDGHAALVDFEIAGDSVEAKDRVDPVLAAVARIQSDHPTWTSSSSAPRAPTRPSTRRSAMTSRAPGCSRSPSRSSSS